jgi:Phage integrase family
MVATVLCTGLRISELLGLVWDDVELAARAIHVHAQLSRAHRGDPARRVAPKTVVSVRYVPLVAQLARPPSAHRHQSRFARGEDWVFATARGTLYGHRNVSRRCLGRAAQIAGLNDDGWPPLRFHDLRHTVASHLIVDLGLDPACKRPAPSSPQRLPQRGDSEAGRPQPQRGDRRGGQAVLALTQSPWLRLEGGCLAPAPARHGGVLEDLGAWLGVVHREPRSPLGVRDQRRAELGVVW